MGAIPPRTGREAGDRRSGRQRRAVVPSPGGSARYRPAVARTGGEREARRRREWGDAMAGGGGREATGESGNG